MPTTANPWLDSLRDEFLNSTPSAAWWRQFGGQVANAPNQNYRRFLEGQEGRMFNQYLGKVADNPALRYTGFLSGQEGGMQSPWNQFQQQTPRQRGVSYGQYQPKLNQRYGVGYR